MAYRRDRGAEYLPSGIMAAFSQWCRGKGTSHLALRKRRSPLSPSQSSTWAEPRRRDPFSCAARRNKRNARVTVRGVTTQRPTPLRGRYVSVGLSYDWRGVNDLSLATVASEPRSPSTGLLRISARFCCSTTSPKSASEIGSLVDDAVGVIVRGLAPARELVLRGPAQCFATRYGWGHLRC
jgi:hypothetical protein